MILEIPIYCRYSDLSMRTIFREMRKIQIYCRYSDVSPIFREMRKIPIYGRYSDVSPIYGILCCVVNLSMVGTLTCQ